MALKVVLDDGTKGIEIWSALLAAGALLLSRIDVLAHPLQRCLGLAASPRGLMDG
jgi:hypothetical protein